METQKEKKGITLSNLALKHLVEELNLFENGFINNVQSLENGWIKIKIHTKQGDKTLALTDNTIFVLEKSIPAKQNPGGFSALIKKYLYNQRIVSLKQHNADRIIVFEFPNHFLIAELFAKGNLVLCTKDYKIIKAMKKEEWKDRKLEKDEIYKFPSSKGIDPLEENKETFYKKLIENKKTIFGACIDILNTAPAVLEKVFSDLKIDKSKNANEISPKKAEEILDKVKQIYKTKEKKVYLSNGVLYSVELDLEKEKEFNSINEALNSLLEEEKKKIVEKNEKPKKIKDENQKIEMIEKQMVELEKEEKEMKLKGDEIYLNYSKIKEIVETIKKGKEKGLLSKEVMEKINSIKPFITELDLEKNKLKLRL